MTNLVIFRAISIITVGDVFRDVIYLIIDQYDHKRPKGASGGHKVSASHAAQASEALVNIIIQKETHTE